MNRVQMISPENAYNRLNELATEFAFDELYRRPVTPSGNGDLIGIINEFPESGLVPTTWLYGFMGTEATWRGLEDCAKHPRGLRVLRRGRSGLCRQKVQADHLPQR